MKAKRLGSIPKGLAWLQEVLEEEPIAQTTITKNVQKKITDEVAVTLSETEPSTVTIIQEHALEDTQETLPAKTISSKKTSSIKTRSDYKNTVEDDTQPARVESPIYQEAKPTSQVGLPKGWTRATLIVREEHLRKLKALAYWERVTIKYLMDQALGAFLEGKRVRSLNVKKQ